MARAMWKGAIQFGLVTIPVKLYMATESKAISFNMLHETDLSRIQMKTYCPVDDEVISRSDTVRGYEYAPGQYVVVTDEDLERVPLKTVRCIEIEQFTKATPRPGHDPLRQERLLPRAGPDRPQGVRLLKSVLAEKGLTAICKVVIKDREALAALDPFGGRCSCRPSSGPTRSARPPSSTCPTEEPEFKPAEKAMAEQLVAAMTGEFDPSDYRDEYREALMGVIEAKVDGREIVAPSRAAGDRQPRRPDGGARGQRRRREEGTRRTQPVSVTEATRPRRRKAAGSEGPHRRRRPTRPSRSRGRAPRRDPPAAARAPDRQELVAA